MENAAPVAADEVKCSHFRVIQPFGGMEQLRCTVRHTHGRARPYTSQGSGIYFDHPEVHVTSGTESADPATDLKEVVQLQRQR